VQANRAVGAKYLCSLTNSAHHGAHSYGQDEPQQSPHHHHPHTHPHHPHHHASEGHHPQNTHPHQHILPGTPHLQPGVKSAIIPNLELKIDIHATSHSRGADSSNGQNRSISPQHQVSPTSNVTSNRTGSPNAAAKSGHSPTTHKRGSKGSLDDSILSSVVQPLPTALAPLVNPNSAVQALAHAHGGEELSKDEHRRGSRGSLDGLVALLNTAASNSPKAANEKVGTPHNTSKKPTTPHPVDESHDRHHPAYGAHAEGGHHDDGGLQHVVCMKVTKDALGHVPEYMRRLVQSMQVNYLYFCSRCGWMLALACIFCCRLTCKSRKGSFGS
jgi:hypothetical protein